MRITKGPTTKARRIAVTVAPAVRTEMYVKTLNPKNSELRGVRRW
jgi:hypothetical protein